MELITIRTAPAEWKGSAQETPVVGWVDRKPVVKTRRWQPAEDLGRYVMVEVDNSVLHQTNPLIERVITERMFLADVGVEPSSDGLWNQWNYLERMPLQEAA